jgi:hypothetical protein
MSQSTPINQLPRETMNNTLQNQQHSSSDMVDDILNEMSVNDDMNTESFNHMMDSSQVPPEKMDGNFLNNNNDGNNNNYNQPDNNQQDNNQQNNSEQNSNNTKESFQNNILSKLKGGNIEELFKNCLKQIKYAIIIFVLVIIVSLPQFNRFVFTKLKGMLLESGEINMKGVLLKGVVATVLFLLLSFIV